MDVTPLVYDTAVRDSYKIADEISRDGMNAQIDYLLSRGWTAESLRAELHRRRAASRPGRRRRNFDAY